MHPSSEQAGTRPPFRNPVETVTRFFNALFGHTRNWPHAYSCLDPEAHRRFEAVGGLPSFADYWEDKLSFLEELVKKRHGEYPYSHRSCFSPASIHCTELSVDRAVVELVLVENHIARERMMIHQTKELSKQGHRWLLASGELEGNLNEIIVVRDLRGRTVSRS